MKKLPRNPWIGPRIEPRVTQRTLLVGHGARDQLVGRMYLWNSHVLNKFAILQVMASINNSTNHTYGLHVKIQSKRLTFFSRVVGWSQEKRPKKGEDFLAEACSGVYQNQENADTICEYAPIPEKRGKCGRICEHAISLKRGEHARKIARIFLPAYL